MCQLGPAGHNWFLRAVDVVTDAFTGRRVPVRGRRRGHRGRRAPPYLRYQCPAIERLSGSALKPANGAGMSR